MIFYWNNSLWIYFTMINFWYKYMRRHCKIWHILSLTITVFFFFEGKNVFYRLRENSISREELMNMFAAKSLLGYNMYTKIILFYLYTQVCRSINCPCFAVIYIMILQSTNDYNLMLANAIKFWARNSDIHFLWKLKVYFVN